MAQGKLLIFCCLALATLTQDSLAFVTARSVKSREAVNHDDVPHAFVIFGATGDLAKREIYPALWILYRDNYLPPKTQFFGYARRPATVDDIRKACAPFISVKPSEEKLYDEFWSLNHFTSGSGNEAYDNLNKEIEKTEENGRGNRAFHLAVPPAAFESTATQIKRACMAKNGWTRILIEKPFGRDLASSEKLSNHLKSLFEEDQIYRNDHFLGYEMVQNLLSLRFANELFASSWNKDNIAAVEINFRENFGVEGRGSYFDANGIIRDVMQNHLLQILSLVAMEKPESISGEDVRDAKVELLKKTKSIDMNDVVIGQYVGNPDSKDPRERIGYLDDPTVSKDSLAATFALTVLKIENERWRGVPFIIRAGKGLDVNRTEVIIQYKDVPKSIFNNEEQRNEIIIRIGHDLALQAKIMSKTPGFSNRLEQITVNFNYDNEYLDLNIPKPYEKLFLDIIRGSQMNFVRSDELTEAWRIFTPILHEIENQKLQPIQYKFGSLGPAKADEIEKKYNFLK